MGLKNSFSAFTDAPRRQNAMYGYPLRAPILEDCRLFLVDWAKKVRDPTYEIPFEDEFHYAKFNNRGEFEFYNNSYGLHYLFEVPCVHTYRAYFDTRLFDVSYHGCLNLYFFLLESAKRTTLDFLDAQLRNNPFFVRFCWASAWLQDFPAKVEPPYRFSFYRIRPSYFFRPTPSGIAFVSPTLLAYHNLLVNKSSAIDDGTPDPDCIVDYWQ